MTTPELMDSGAKKESAMDRSKMLIALSVVLSVIAIIVSGVTLLALLGVSNVSSPVSTNFNAQVRAYLLENPEIIIESVEGLEADRQAAEVDDLQTAIVQSQDELLNSRSSPVTGNPNGDVTIVEFFDYNCPYCRKAAPILAEAAAADPELRFVFKEWPILGPGSQFAARAALASQAQGKYEAFHKAMMARSGAINESSTLEVAAKVGIDVERLKRDMENPAVAAEIERNLALSGTLRITGTPSFVIGEEIVRGLVDLATLQAYIADARKPEASAGDGPGE